MVIIFGLIAATNATGTPAACDGSTTLNGTAYNQHDIDHQRGIATWQACCALCQANAKCNLVSANRIQSKPAVTFSLSPVHLERRPQLLFEDKRSAAVCQPSRSQRHRAQRANSTAQTNASPVTTDPDAPHTATNAPRNLQGRQPCWGILS